MTLVIKGARECFEFLKILMEISEMPGPSFVSRLSMSFMTVSVVIF